MFSDENVISETDGIVIRFHDTKTERHADVIVYGVNECPINPDCAAFIGKLLLKCDAADLEIVLPLDED